MKVEASAPGKIFLSGEYLAIEGSLATVLPTIQRAKIIIEESKSSTNILYSLPLDKSFAFDVNDSFDIEWLDDNPMDMGLFIEKAIVLMQIKPTTTRFTIDTTDFYFQRRKIGIGSSSAISSALIKAINKYFDIKQTHEMIIDNALNLHNSKQDSLGSGLDVIASSLDSGLIECDIKKARRGKWTKLEWPSDLLIKGVITSDESNTKEMIKKYLKGHAKNKEFFLALKIDADQILEELSLSWQSKDSESILALMKQYNILMQQLDEKYHLGIYTEEHKALANITTKLGLIYKPSGAGGGDLGLILTDNEMKLEQLIAKLKDNDFQTLDLI
tara:strand:- start:266 stop:1255 length:990 start_codon:yes stop_codon:yes gene_type:complete